MPTVEGAAAVLFAMRRAARCSRLLLTFATAVLVVACFARSGTAAPPGTVKVWFVQGEQMISVVRPGSTVDDAVAQLLAGPTAAEAKQGIRTYVPAGTPLRGVVVAGRVATVDLGLAFVSGRGAQSLLARLSQVVYTASGVEGVKKVRLKIEGGTPLGLFPGVETSVPLTVEYLQTPNVPVPKQPLPEPTPVVATVRQAQERLAALGFFLPRDVDGRAGPATESAVLAFQKWEGLPRDGQLGPPTLARLRTAKHPEPLSRGGPGKRVEVLLDRQVALAIENDKVLRVIHVSTGKSSTPTPTGLFRVYTKVARWWSVPFREWLLWAVPFNGGIAIHEFSEVPPYAASHGCVRNMYTTAHWMYDFAKVGMPVRVISGSR